jgi:hypothetical protein
MPGRGKARLRQAELRNAVAAAVQGGLDVGRIEITPNGVMRLYTRASTAKAEETTESPSES